MFSGAGVFAEGVMFGIVAGGVLYLKADADFAAEFAAEGKGPFTYQPKGRSPISMSYWEVPERLLDDFAEFASWARRAHAIALAASARETARKRPKKRQPPQRR